MIIVEIFPKCDKCEEADPILEQPTKALCRENMKKFGWKTRRTENGTIDICPECVEAEGKTYDYGDIPLNVRYL